MTTETDDLVAKLVGEVEPVLRRNAARAEAEKRLAPETMTALIDAGIISSGLPRAYGGLELTPTAFTKLIEELARVDSAAGWVAMICGAVDGLTAILPKEGGDEIFADPRAVCCGAWFPPGAAEPVQGGFKVSGRWNFGSGCNYATYLTGQAFVMENGAPKIGPNGQPEALIVFFAASDAQIHENWNTLGMRGTGSHDFEVRELFIPDRRVWPIGPWEPRNPLLTSILHRAGVWTAGPFLAACAIGIARAAIDELVDLAGMKTPSYTQTGLADRPVVQDKLARARAVVDAARSYIYSTLADAEEYLSTEPKLDIEYGIPLALAGSFGMEAAAQAVDLVHACAGTSAIRAEKSFEQHFRDVHTLTQHAFSSPSRFESVGKLMLGRESDWPFYYL